MLCPKTDRSNACFKNNVEYTFLLTSELIILYMSYRKRFLSIQCTIYPMYYLSNVLSILCTIYPINYLSNLLSIHCTIYPMYYLSNVLSIQCTIYPMYYRSVYDCSLHQYLTKSHYKVRESGAKMHQQMWMLVKDNIKIRNVNPIDNQVHMTIIQVDIVNVRRYILM